MDLADPPLCPNNCNLASRPRSRKGAVIGPLTPTRDHKPTFATASRRLRGSSALRERGTIKSPSDAPPSPAVLTCYLGAATSSGGLPRAEAAGAVCVCATNASDGSLFTHRAGGPVGVCEPLVQIKPDRLRRRGEAHGEQNTTTATRQERARHNQP